MIQDISNWAEGIIVAVIIATIIEMLLPEGKNKKYVKTIIGIYVVFTIISPVIENFKKEKIDFNKISTYYEEIDIPKNAINISSTLIEETYMSKLEEDIKQRMNEKGYRVINVKFDIDVTEGNYGTINRIDLTIKKNSLTEVSTVNEVKVINITINNNEIIEENLEINNEEKKELKEYLNTNYGVESANIYINS